MTSSPHRRRRLLASAGAAALVCGACFVPAPVSAAPANPVLKAGNITELRAAVRVANARPGADRIELRGNVNFTGPAPTSDENGPATGDLDVKDDLVVDGKGLRIDANGLSRIFDVSPGTSLRLRSLLMYAGNAVGGAGGGTIRSAGALTLSDVRIQNGRSAAASGGAVLSTGTLVVQGSTILRSSAATSGGAIEVAAGSARISGSAVQTSRSTSGGGVHVGSGATLAVVESRFNQNAAGVSGGALASDAGSTVTVDGAVFAANTAEGADAGQGGGAVRSAGSLTIRSSTLTRNAATGAAGSGGAVLNDTGSLEIDESVVTRNQANRAGGGVETNAGQVEVTGSTFTVNSAGAAPGNGGALHATGASTVTFDDGVASGNTAVEGGGLWNSAAGEMTVSDSTISDNQATGDAADQGGGGLYNDGGSLTVTGSTVDGNDATGVSGSGGGVLNNLGTLTVTSSRMTGNTAPRAGGGIEVNVGTASLSNVDLAGNSTGANPGRGGGLHLTGAAVVTYSEGSVTGNTASNEGGGLWNSSTGTLTATGIRARDNAAPVAPNVYTQPGGTFTLNGTVVPAGDNSIST